MTLPQGMEYSDFASPGSGWGPVAVKQTYSGVLPATLATDIPCGGFGSIYLRGVPDVHGAYRLAITWKARLPGSSTAEVVAEDFVDIADPSLYASTAAVPAYFLPVKGTTFDLKVLHGSGVPNAITVEVFFVTGAPSARPVMSDTETPETVMSDGVLLAENYVSPAGSNFFRPFNVPWFGRARISWDIYTAGVIVQVQSAQWNAVTLSQYVFDMGKVLPPVELLLPRAAFHQVGVHNTTAGAVTSNVVVVGDITQ